MYAHYRRCFEGRAQPLSSILSPTTGHALVLASLFWRQNCTCMIAACSAMHGVIGPLYNGQSNALNAIPAQQVKPGEYW